tara:strand:+ start:483 stop:884 length:402 start_codon:yes stop_codon:yes gene_type:complete
MKIILTIILIFISHICCAQQNIDINYTNSEIKKLLEISKIKNLNTQISVYSIQLDANEKPEKIIKTKKKYATLFPNEQIDELFEAPYFKLILGNYLDKKQAEKKLKNIKHKFNSAFVLKREISIEKFKTNNQR